MFQLVPEDAVDAKTVINGFSRIFFDKVIPETTKTTFILLNVRKNHVLRESQALRDMFRTSQITDWPRIVAFGGGEDG